MPQGPPIWHTSGGEKCTTVVSCNHSQIQLVVMGLAAYKFEGMDKLEDGLISNTDPRDVWFLLPSESMDAMHADAAANLRQGHIMTHMTRCILAMTCATRFT